jgi:hypothetical protein
MPPVPSPGLWIAGAKWPRSIRTGGSRGYWPALRPSPRRQTDRPTPAR